MAIRIFGLSFCALFCTFLALPAGDPPIYHIGLVDSLFKDLSEGKKELIDTDFPSLVEEFTGLKSDVIKGGDAFEEASSLTSGKWQLDFTQGVEFAWIHQENPQIKPLLVAINREPVLHALLVTRDDGKISGFDDLKGQPIAVLKGRVHCR